jgi:hypothetical protein
MAKALIRPRRRPGSLCGPAAPAPSSAPARRKGSGVHESGSIPARADELLGSAGLASRWRAATSGGSSRWPRPRRNCRSASSIPAAVPRRRISPERQRFTLRCVWRTISIMNSHAFVDARVSLKGPQPEAGDGQGVGEALPERRPAPRCVVSSWRASASRAASVARWSRSSQAARAADFKVPRLWAGFSRPG